MDESINLIDYYDFNIVDKEPEETLLREWQLIKEGCYGYESKNSWNKLIKQFQLFEFYKTELAMWKENKFYRGLPLRSWLYMNRKKYIGKGYGELTQQEVLRGFKISGIHIGNSFHSPFYIKQFIKDYNVQSIYDPCGGWGHRLLGAKSLEIDYIYNDINSNTCSNCKALANFLKLNVTFYNSDSANFTPKESYEAVFTCPPYYNTEIYSSVGSENLSYPDFLNWWKATIQHSCINKSECRYFAFVINHIYEKDMLGICKNLGLHLVNEHILGCSKAKGHFLAKSNIRKYEKLLILTK